MTSLEISFLERVSFWSRFFLFGCRFLLWWFFLFRSWLFFGFRFFFWRWFFLRWNRFFFTFRRNRSELFIWTSNNNIIGMIASFSATLMTFMELTFFSCALNLRCIYRSALLYTIWTPFRFISRRIFWRYREWRKLITLAYWFTENSSTFFTKFVCADASPSCLEAKSFVHSERTIGLSICHLVCWADLGSTLNTSIRMLFLISDSVLFLWNFLVVNLIVFGNFKLCFCRIL